MFVKEDLANVLAILDFAWKEGGVRSEQQAVAFSQLRQKTEQILQNPALLAPKPPVKLVPKKKGDCCGDKGKDEPDPNGPPTVEGEEKAEEPKAEG